MGAFPAVLAIATRCLLGSCWGPLFALATLWPRFGLAGFGYLRLLSRLGSWRSRRPWCALGPWRALFGQSWLRRLIAVQGKVADWFAAHVTFWPRPCAVAAP